MPESKTRPRLVSISQAADTLSVSQDLIRRLIARGELPATRIGSKVIRIRQDDIDRLISGGAR